MLPVLLLLLAADAPEKPLYAGKAPGAKGESDADIPRLAAYLPGKKKATGAAVVVCPGGGYGAVMMSYEGRDVAKWFADRGIAGYVLRYRLGPRYNHPIPLQDVRRAIRQVKADAKANGLDPERVGVMGFSAGGHLASCAATMHDKGDPESADPVERFSSRPAFAILAYPVIDLGGKFGHAGSRRNLLGDKPDKELLASLSTQTRVTKDTPPVFLFHTREDKAVPAESSELFAEACKKAGVPVRLKVCKDGPHGVGLALKAKGDCKDWADDVIPWLKEIGMLKGGARDGR
ncbi:MAG: alpha/beta hydrolase [Gemmataceae bacterium]|nr:alpha/beta hydrolase [Gemmataceae bacterium]